MKGIIRLVGGGAEALSPNLTPDLGLNPHQIQAAQHGSPQLCICSNTGAEPSRPIGVAAALREQILMVASVPAASSSRHFGSTGTMGPGHLRTGLPIISVEKVLPLQDLQALS